MTTATAFTPFTIAFDDDHLSRLAPRAAAFLISAVAAQRLRIGDQHAFGAEIDQHAQILQAVEPENAVGADMLAPQQRGEQAGEARSAKRPVDLDQISRGAGCPSLPALPGRAGAMPEVNDFVTTVACAPVSISEAIGPLTTIITGTDQPLVAIAVDRLIGGRGRHSSGPCRGIRLKLHMNIGTSPAWQTWSSIEPAASGSESQSP